MYEINGSLDISKEQIAELEMFSLCPMKTVNSTPIMTEAVKQDTLKSQISSQGPDRSCDPGAV
jgi:hypothetical protein